ncbi:MAG: hypothetical protein V7K41_28020 [Nostoc sp.]|uniref:hypothetical protein n=1 Tax=Nostoc sp. TaxID=1180 RepID=UPI002FFAF2AA
MAARPIIWGRFLYVLFLVQACLLTMMARLVVCVINSERFLVSDLSLNFKGFSPDYKLSQLIKTNDINQYYTLA